MDVQWRDTSSLSGGLRVSFGLGASATRYTFFVLDGRSPLRGDADRARIEEVWSEPKTVCVKDPCYFAYSATPTTHVTNLPVDVGIMTDQTFDVFVSHFYRMPMPAGYTLTP